MNLFTELRRRNVFRVGIAYGVVAWLVIQAADITLDNFGAPGWVFKTVAGLSALHPVHGAPGRLPAVARTRPAAGLRGPRRPLSLRVDRQKGSLSPPARSLARAIGTEMPSGTAVAHTIQ
ncbi:MAG: hypothetical protein RQ847_03295 [Wenzhouxiangellaceae bacterium]|nr:hypothetical protein [Wenzhouxiangellaceae bacterium]